ncbi:adhesion G-protein coupled receptor G6 isoform X3 [Hydra vulgaris]|uniref:adhesion G-protein coupled receptor G6 isoform X3 n=1 Tax=Hydra vulgaris TaxID=6087 RepID=UPI0032EA7A65
MKCRKWHETLKIYSKNLKIYWGQNGGGIEKELIEYCSSQSAFDTIVIGYVNDFFSSNEIDNYPSLNLANHCSFPIISGFNSLLYCEQVEVAIKICQQNNISVQIALGGSYGVYSIANATQGDVFAKRIWEMFLGGNGPRPFGSAVLNGVNLDITQGPYTGYSQFVKTMHDLMFQDKNRTYVISSTSRCSDLKPLKNLGETLTLYGDYFDEIYVIYYSDTCTSKGEFFNIEEWFSFTNKFIKKPLVYISLLAAPIAQFEEYYQDSIGLENIIKKVSFHENFGGIVLYDAGYNEGTLVNNTKYSDVVKKILNENFLTVTSTSTIRNLTATSTVTSTLIIRNINATAVTSTSRNVTTQPKSLKLSTTNSIATLKKENKTEPVIELFNMNKIRSCNDSLCVKDLAYNMSSLLSNHSLIVSSKVLTNFKNVMSTIVEGIKLLSKNQLYDVVDDTMSSVSMIIRNLNNFKEAERNSEASSGFINVLEQMGQVISSKPFMRNSSLEVSKDQIMLKVTSVEKDNLFIYAVEGKNQSIKVIMKQGNKSSLIEKDHFASVQIPDIAFINKKNVVFVLAYRTAALFMVNNTELSNELSKQAVIGKIISVTLSNTTVQQLSKPIIITFEKVDKDSVDSSATCKYWNSTKGWSTEGCVKIEESCEAVKCHCYHLTNFALILDVTQTKNNPFYLQVLTWVGTTLSLAALIFTIATIIIIKNLRKQYFQQLLLNLCASLLVLIIVFLTFAERKCKSKWQCIVVALIIQFFTLSTFCWKSAVCLKLYRDFVQIFNFSKAISLWKVHLFAWGFPFLVVSITFGVAKTHIISSRFCLIQGNAFYIAVLLPCVLILGLNILVLLSVLIRILSSNNKCSKGQRQSSREVLKSIKIALAFSSLLGITWIFSIFAIAIYKLFDVYEYVYSFCCVSELTSNKILT